MHRTYLLRKIEPELTECLGSLQLELLRVKPFPNLFSFRSPKLIEEIKIAAQIPWFMRSRCTDRSEVVLGEHQIFLKIEAPLSFSWQAHRTSPFVRIFQSILGSLPDPAPAGSRDTEDLPFP